MTADADPAAEAARLRDDEALEDQHGFGIDAYNVGNERRWGWIGATSDGRLLQIVFTRRGELVRPISARDASPHHLRRYRGSRR